MLVVTGANGFIGSCLVSRLNQLGRTDIVAVDKFGIKSKEPNLTKKQISDRVDRDNFFSWLNENKAKVSFVFHIGARTDTTEVDVGIFDKLNLNYTKQLWEVCSENSIPMIYASSAATYGLGELGYKDDEGQVGNLKPLNPYGRSKNDFDIWALRQSKKPPFWAGLKFFNVYGPNEYHKGRMASVIFHAFRQIKETGRMRLFRSHNPKYADGGQMRDFVYVKDVLNVIQYLWEEKPLSGIYNLGSGKARTFLDLVNATFKAMGLPPDISFIDTPEDIRDTYQYFTEADMGKLIATGYTGPFHSLESGIDDYVGNYLSKNSYY